MKQATVQKNTLFIILIGITGLSFGILDWESVLSDIIYLKFDNLLLISVISANIGTMRLIATLSCIKINDSKRPNFVFRNCVIISVIGAIILSIVYNLEIVLLFSIAYLLEVLVLEIFSMYHYSYTYNSLPTNIATIVHSKRISVFKITFAIGIGFANYISAQFLDKSFMILCLVASMIFLISITFINQVKNEPKEKQNKVSLKEKLDIRRYSKFYKLWLTSRIFQKFALTNIIVILSVHAIEIFLDVNILKSVKSILWILSSIGFLFSEYFIRRKIIIKGDIIIKIVIVLLLPIIFIFPQIIFLILLLNGLLNPFDTMSNLTFLKEDKDNINIAQKELIVNLCGHLMRMLAGYILININIIFSICIICIALIFGIVLEIISYQKIKKE